MAQRSGFPGFSGALHGGGTPKDDTEPSYNDGRPAALVGVGIDQRLNNPVPLDLEFTDETGAAVTLRDYMTQGKPVILSLAYYSCPMLCTQVLNGLASSLKGVGLVPGTDFEMITVSFDSTETTALAAAKRANYVELVDRPGIEKTWHFLTGKGAPIAALTDAVGFRYEWDDETKQFAHASAIMVLTPEGLVSRYLFGMEFAPRDLKLALIEASDNKIGNVVDQVLLFCFHYDPATGQYGAAIMNILRLAALLTILGLAGLLFILLRRERGHRASDLLARPVGGR
ncbi:MAG: SCO family protein [Candidatus Eisenbacteria bacterium]|nr:SCO family protein [Candidatus Eisenbacteria bacterium]